MRTEHCRGAAVLERWQNGIALASKASARKGLGVRIPRAPYLKPKPPGSFDFGGFGFQVSWVRFRTPVRAGVTERSDGTETTEDPEGTGGESLALRARRNDPPGSDEPGGFFMRWTPGEELGDWAWDPNRFPKSVARDAEEGRVRQRRPNSCPNSPGSAQNPGSALEVVEGGVFAQRGLTD